MKELSDFKYRISELRLIIADELRSSPASSTSARLVPITDQPAGSATATAWCYYLDRADESEVNVSFLPKEAASVTVELQEVKFMDAMTWRLAKPMETVELKSRPKP